jgi:hypothetical protein
MKTILLALVCLFLTKVSLSQKELLSFDEHNKYIYYQVVDMPGVPADTLNIRGAGFIKTNYPGIKLKAADLNGLSGSGKFLVYGGISVLKHEKGEITYKINIEFKDQKYRYWLTGFAFTPYQRDRYGNFVPEQGLNIPLETAQSKLDEKDIDGYLDETGAFCKQFGENLKLYLLKAPAIKKEETTKKVVTDKW